MARFMKVVEKYAKLENCWIAEERGEKWTHENVGQLWSKISNKHIFHLYSGKKSRNETFSWQTILKNMKTKGAFKKTRAACNSDEEWKRSVYYTGND